MSPGSPSLYHGDPVLGQDPDSTPLVSPVPGPGHGRPTAGHRVEASGVERGGFLPGLNAQRGCRCPSASQPPPLPPAPPSSGWEKSQRRTLLLGGCHLSQRHHPPHLCSRDRTSSGSEKALSFIYTSPWAAKPPLPRNLPCLLSFQAQMCAPPRRSATIWKPLCRSPPQRFCLRGVLGLHPLVRSNSLRRYSRHGRGSCVSFCSGGGRPSVVTP